MTSENVLSVRDDILRQIDGLTTISALDATAKAHPDAPAYSDRRTTDGSPWRTITWGDLQTRARDVAAGLMSVGVEAGDRVCIMASSRIEHVVADAGAVHAGAVPISTYATLSPSQVAWYARHATPTVVVLEGPEQVERWS